MQWYLWICRWWRWTRVESLLVGIVNSLKVKLFIFRIERNPSNWIASFGYYDSILYLFEFFRSTNLPKDFYAAQSFLSACYDGPMFALLNRLTDVQPLYEYPITQLPHTRQVHQGNQGSVFLNAFEFYFYHLFKL